MSSSQSHTVCLREAEQLCESGDKAIGGGVVGDERAKCIL